MRWFITLIFSISLFSFLSLVPHQVLATATTGECLPTTPTSTDTSDPNKVGIFMVRVCSECWDQGDCSLKDILTTVANIGNYILSIVAGLVFLVYILGGFWWVASHGNPAWVQKGKDYIKNATFGLMIILFSYAGVYTLQSVIQTGSIGSEDTSEESSGVICDGSEESAGKSCGVNMRCAASGGCYSECAFTFSGDRTCYDTDLGTDDEINILDCLEGYCPGGESVQCCGYYSFVE